MAGATVKDSIKSISLESLCDWSPNLQEWIGNAKFETSQTLQPNLRTLGIVSSHDQHSMFTRPNWIRGLETALSLARRSKWTILIASATPYAEAIRHFCKRFELQYLCFETEIDIHRSANRDIDNCIAIHADKSAEKLVESSIANAPLHDRAVVGFADHLFAIQVRPRGKMERLLLKRLSCDYFPKASLFIGMNYRREETKTTTKTKNKLLEKGAVGWFALPHEPIEIDSSNRLTNWACRLRAVPATRVPIFRSSQIDWSTDRWLVHCTRQRRGSWPDQSNDQLLDESLLEMKPAVDSTLASLIRILELKRLVATNHLRRTRISTVCFSECPLPQLLSMRRFEQHKSQWDWEPYGILVNRGWLSERGASPVKYLPAQEMNSLSEDESVFAQPSGDSGSGRNWTVEREWRIRDDLRLAHLPFSKGLVFVPTIEEANQVASISAWPVVIMDYRVVH